jgi:alanyl-tRNA synthetase
LDFFVLAIYLGKELIKILDKQKEETASEISETENYDIETATKAESIREEISRNELKEEEVNYSEKAKKMDFKKTEKKRIKTQKIEKISSESSNKEKTDLSNNLARRLKDKDELKRAVIYSEIFKSKY